MSDDPQRCGWSTGSAQYLAYHDLEWGVPQRDPQVLFEFVILEGAQAGLSWSTILNKRDGYRTAFAGFDPTRVAAFGPADEERLLAEAGIVRNRAKITAAIGNARAWLELDEPSDYLWSFVDGVPVQNHRQRGPHARRAGRGTIGQGALGLRRPGVVAPAAGRH